MPYPRAMRSVLARMLTSDVVKQAGKRRRRRRRKKRLIEHFIPVRRYTQCQKVIPGGSASGSPPALMWN